MSTTFLFFNLVITLCVVNFQFSYSFQDVNSVNIREKLFHQKNGPCSFKEYRCLNNKCVEKSYFCNGRNDCGDNSDEMYCHGSSCPAGLLSCVYRFPSRNSYKRCLPKYWVCDGVVDCNDQLDESDCDKTSVSGITPYQVKKAAEAALSWLSKTRISKNPIQKWGSNLPRKAITFYFSQFSNFTTIEDFTDELACELSSGFLSKLALRKIEDIKTFELSMYVNSFLSFCINPRRFFVIDLVKELRKRVDSQSSVNPYALLTLCNAKEPIVEGDIAKLVVAFQKASKEERTDTQAIIIMALACASSQDENLISQENIFDLTLDIKKKQYRNGTVENIKTTALVLQALFASEQEPDEDNFDEEKAIKQILLSQEKDGSFGGLMNTYYVLPVLFKSSLVNISADHCSALITTEDEELEFLRNRVGEKWNISYSIWIGEEKYLKRTLSLKVPASTSFYEIMEHAANLDSKYKFKCNVRNRKPYLFALSDIMDDPEMQMFWYPYYLPDNSTEPIVLTKSPSDIIPDNNQHLIYWYRKAM